MSRHLKALSAPKFWRIPPKKTHWVVRARPGPYKKFESIPLIIILRDILKMADTAKDAKKIIKSGEIFVDEIPRKDPKFPAGLMNVIQIKKLKKYYRIVMTHSGLKIIEISKKESKLKLCRINRKNTIKGNKLQLGLHDGRCILLDSEEIKNYSTGDSLLIELPTQKIIEHIKMENGNIGFIIGGENKGKLVKIKSIKKTRSREPNKVVCELEGRELDAVKDDVFVVGKSKPLIKIME